MEDSGDKQIDYSGMAMSHDQKEKLLHQKDKRIAGLEAVLTKVIAVGFNEDCLFCGFKDRAASKQDPVEDLRKAVADVEHDHPLPRCEHGAALRDHAGEVLAPPCGCEQEAGR